MCRTSNTVFIDMSTFWYCGWRLRGKKALPTILSSQVCPFPDFHDLDFARKRLYLNVPNILWMINTLCKINSFRDQFSPLGLFLRFMPFARHIRYILKQGTSRNHPKPTETSRNHPKRTETSRNHPKRAKTKVFNESKNRNENEIYNFRD